MIIGCSRVKRYGRVNIKNLEVKTLIVNDEEKAKYIVEKCQGILKEV